MYNQHNTGLRTEHTERIKILSWSWVYSPTPANYYNWSLRIEILNLTEPNAVWSVTSGNLLSICTWWDIKLLKQLRHVNLQTNNTFILNFNCFQVSIRLNNSFVYSRCKLREAQLLNADVVRSLKFSYQTLSRCCILLF